MKQNCLKNKSSCWQNFFLCDRSILYSPFYLSLSTLATEMAVLFGNDVLKTVLQFYEKGFRFSRKSISKLKC